MRFSSTLALADYKVRATPAIEIVYVIKYARTGL
jgi:hypothetical protein